jgi:aquaporin Z
VLVASNDYAADLCAKPLTEKEIAMDASLLRKWIVEFIGTFFLVYVVGCVSLQEHVLLGPLAIGASLMVMIFAGGHISGGHYNPAVTLGVWIRGACGTVEASFYLVAQVIGAIVASIAVAFLLGHGSSPAPSTVTVAPVMLAEGLGTFALVYTVLNVATAPATSGNSFYGLAIGFTVFAQAVAVGKVSGGRFQPRRRHWRCCAGAGERVESLDVLAQRVFGCRCRSGFLSPSQSGKTTRSVSSLPR